MGGCASSCERGLDCDLGFASPKCESDGVTVVLVSQGSMRALPHFGLHSLLTGCLGRLLKLEVAVGVSMQDAYLQI